MKRYKFDEARFRSIKVTYSDGTVISTNMAGHVTDQQIKDYFHIGQVFNIGKGPHDKLVKVKSVEILPDEEY